MSRTLRSRLFTSAGSAAALAASRMVQAQRPEPARALLNYSIVALSPRDPAVNWLLGPAEESAAQSEGEQALLGRRSAIAIRAPASLRREPIGGEAALLGKEPR